MAKDSSKDRADDTEAIVRRRDRALARALSMSPIPHKAEVGAKPPSVEQKEGKENKE